MSRPHPFAPGAIERHRPPLGNPHQRRELLRWLYASLLVMAVASVTGLIAGLLAGWLD